MRLPGSGISGHRADHDLVVATAHADDGQDRGVVAENPVVARPGVDRHPVDAAVNHSTGRGARRVPDHHNPSTEGPRADGVQREPIRTDGAVDDQLVVT